MFFEVPKKYHLIKDKYTSSDYKQYAKNFGFGQNFLPFEAETKQEKIEKAKKRQEYSRIINEQNLKKNNGLQNSKNPTSNSNNNLNTFNPNPNVYSLSTNDTLLSNVKHFDISKRNNNFKVIYSKLRIFCKNRSFLINQFFVLRVKSWQEQSKK